MTAEVVEAGGPGRPRSGVALGAAAALLAGLAVYNAARDERPSQPPPSPVATRSTHAMPAPRAGSWRLAPPRERTRLLVAGAAVGLRVLDVDSRRVTVTPLPEVAETVPVAAVAGGWLVVQRAHCPTFACVAPVYAVQSGRVTFVGRADRADVAHDGRSVWLSGYTSRTAEPDSNPRWYQRRGLDGARLGPRTTMRPRERVVGVTAAGLVTAYVEDGRRVVAVLAGGRRRVVVPDGVPLAVGGSRVAWTTTECDPRPAGCRLAVTDLTTGTTTRLAGPAREVNVVALDPTGRRLAVAFELRPVTVYDTASGAATQLPLPAPPDAQSLTWSPDGRWLLVTHADVDVTTGGQVHRLALWRPGLRRALAAPAYAGEGRPVFAVAKA